MKEDDILLTIKSVIGEKYIGDDCAYIKELGLVVTQDSLVEDIHFSKKYMSPYQLGYKSGMVNISDISASGGIPKYMSVALSLPKDISTEFVREFYQGLSETLNGIEIIGGDITGSDKIMVSITLIGIDKDRHISSRANAKSGQVIVTSGVHGSSAAGLKLLIKGKRDYENPLIKSHLMPVAQIKFGSNISKNINEDYAMMDTSDGLADALFKIAKASNKTLIVDFSKIIYDKTLKTNFPDEYENLILYGGEDYQIIATVPEYLAKSLNLNIIGKVEPKSEYFVKIKNMLNGEKIIDNLNNCYNHFETV